MCQVHFAHENRSYLFRAMGSSQLLRVTLIRVRMQKIERQNVKLLPHTFSKMEHPSEVRRAAREGYTGLTVGLARGYRQANLVVLPSKLAEEFLGFCEMNPLSCPVLGSSTPGSPTLEGLGSDIDIRTDVPRYQVYRDGEAESRASIEELWNDDLVAIALGCWFGAEGALAAAGVRMRHAELGVQGPLFRTTIPAIPYGRFNSNIVLSMRPFQTKDVARVAAITAELPMSHGAPLDIDSPNAAGITDLANPDWGEPLIAEPGEVSLFFRCGLTATAALLDAGVEFFITHSAGSMLVTDQEEIRP